ncbi:uncharacterized protein [Drosophila pseudoobscura]|uniref:Uncharacterized protein n=1 Tax=Drosophila pseudoobscura pseudoobscura TaxID=46245 RepID=A0A6I8W7W3_DROPS|nr:uncharacterized protein LOC117184752 [Drosophila pseudoobscura]
MECSTDELSGSGSGSLIGRCPYRTVRAKGVGGVQQLPMKKAGTKQRLTRQKCDKSMTLAAARSAKTSPVKMTPVPKWDGSCVGSLPARSRRLLCLSRVSLSPRAGHFSSRGPWPLRRIRISVGIWTDLRFIRPAISLYPTFPPPLSGCALVALGLWEPRFLTAFRRLHSSFTDHF